MYHALEIKDSFNEELCSFLIDRVLTREELIELDTILNTACENADWDKDYDIADNAAIKWFNEKGIKQYQYRYTEILLEHSAFD